MTLCPLCFLGPSEELHLLLHCVKMRDARSWIFVNRGQSLEASLLAHRQILGPSGDAQTVRNFFFNTYFFLNH